MYFVLPIRLTLLSLLVLIFTSSPTFAQERLLPPLSSWASTYPQQANAAAEVLEKRVVATVDSQMRKTVTTYVAIRINEQSAIDDYSQINIHFNDYFRTLELDFANVLTAQGKLVGVREDAIQIQSQSNENFYVDSKSLAFSLPLTYAGSIIEFQYTSKHKKHKIPNEVVAGGSLSYWERANNPQGYRSDFVHYSEYRLEIPSSKNIYYDTPGTFPIDYQTKTTSGITTHQWSMRNIAAAVLQNYLPEDLYLSPYIDITTIKQWQGIAQWGATLIEPTIQSNAAIKEVAENIRRTTRDKNEQIKAVFNYMQNNIRYVFAHVGRGGYEPHNTTEVIANGYGDCKDQTVLTIAILRELGIKANAALMATTNTSSPNEKIPYVAFDHMITYIPQQGSIAETWIDTVGGNFLFPGISNQVNKQKALIIDNSTKNLVTINSLLNKPNAIYLDMNVAAPKNNKLVSAFNIRFEGEIESSIRSWLRYYIDDINHVKKLIDKLYPSATIENLAVHNYHGFEEEVEISGDFVFTISKEEIEKNKDNPPFNMGINIARFASLFSILPTLEETKDRVHPIATTHQYQVITNTNIEKPPGYTLVPISVDGLTDNNKVYHYDHNTKKSSSSIHVEQTLTLFPINSSVEDYRYIYDHIKKLDERYWSMGLVYDQDANDIEMLKTALDTKKSEVDFIDLAQLLIDQAKYNEAMTQINQALLLFPNSGHLFYLQGLAHAYLGNSADADSAFQQAEELGYEI